MIVITGGARGIGLATATALHILGAKVAIGDVDEVRVKVTRAAGAMVASQKFMPQSLAEGLNRVLGGEQVFTNEVDVDKRKALRSPGSRRIVSTTLGAVHSRHGQSGR